ncbi:unnamed protein product [Diatraea saccharalis]|uniref:Uncharacterized protein n=1 Tax=Diatraea saccharalis TaxID=40085 RepID=A0A9N9QUG1_9NEOP|nr:unnamed protein product [Diatraea saccharalis]
MSSNCLLYFKYNNIVLGHYFLQKITFVMFLVIGTVCCLAYEKRIKVDPFRPVPPTNPDRETSLFLLRTLKDPERFNTFIAVSNLTNTSTGQLPTGQIPVGQIATGQIPTL